MQLLNKMAQIFDTFVKLYRNHQLFYRDGCLHMSNDDYLVQFL